MAFSQEELDKIAVELQSGIVSEEAVKLLARELPPFVLEREPNFGNKPMPTDW